MHHNSFSDYLTTLHVKIDSFIGNAFGNRGPQLSHSTLENYHFYPYFDSLHGDIERITSGGLDEIATACRKNSECLGFNSDGYLKKELRDISDWYFWKNDETKGLYVKKACLDRDFYDKCELWAGQDQCKENPG